MSYILASEKNDITPSAVIYFKKYWLADYKSAKQLVLVGSTCGMSLTVNNKTQTINNLSEVCPLSQYSSCDYLILKYTDEYNAPYINFV